ncbi:helix-turn-helix transcriptional regulator [Chitinophaga pendula]|uniref:winged helix-turn-helix transcriptional regulator n=1 Tax=Chitinophaga TaxID=79328 RepID=UPI000BAFD393|nr:transcriptional regulator [Chitinophaga sp. MD30]UCJ08875.1 helix-turn-helix transcriptional regulator [Chitinophaga pendula]
MKSNEKKSERFLDLQRTITAGPDAYKHTILYDCCSIFANKWNLLVLVSLMQETKRNSELLQQIHGISPKMLNESLRKLMSLKMVERMVYPEVPPRVEYSLTDFGRSLSQPLEAILDWHEEWRDKFQSLYR